MNSTNIIIKTQIPFLDSGEHNHPVIIIMAGGLGTRMNSNVPKVLHCLGDKPLLLHVINNARKLCPTNILVVVGKYEKMIHDVMMTYTTLDDIEFIQQPIAQGTGHAIQCCLPYFESNPSLMSSNVLILSGDVPLLSADSMKKMVETTKSVKIMTTVFKDPHGYGRIVKDSKGYFEKIVEEKDCNLDQREIRRVNCGIYSFKVNILCKYLPHLRNDNSQGEYYLTDIVEMICGGEDVKAGMFNMPRDNHYEVVGVNTIAQLCELEQIYLAP